MPKSSTQLRPSQLRIIGGQWRGRKLAIADVDGLRPTGDRIRETLFNWLMADITGSCCLDLFAGSGALGFECLSRGANQVSLFEKHPKAAKQLLANCQKLNAHNGQIIQADSIAWINEGRVPKHSVDLVFIDPPFAANLWQNTLEAVDSNEVLKEGAIVYVETPRNTVITPPRSWQLYKEKIAGQVAYRLYQNLLIPE